jgi:hypothetical protein
LHGYAAVSEMMSLEPENPQLVHESGQAMQQNNRF